jgi:hypothetical protein
LRTRAYSAASGCFRRFRHLNDQRAPTIMPVTRRHPAWLPSWPRMASAGF